MVFAFALATVPVLYEADVASFAQFLEMRIRINDFLIFTGLLIVWHFIFTSFGLYHSHRLGRPRAEMASVIKAVTLSTFVVFVAALFLRISMVTPVFLVMFWAIGSGLVVMSRLTLRYLLKRVRLHGRNLRFVLIAGTNDRAIELARQIETTPELGYRIIGFADEEWPGTEAFHRSGYKVVCGLDDFPGFLRDSIVDEVVMALPIRSYYFHASRIAAICEEQGITMRFPSGIFNLKLARSKAEDFEGHALITLYTGTRDGWPVAVKRLVDFGLSLLALVALAPLFLIVALFMKLTDPGPVFF